MSLLGRFPFRTGWAAALLALPVVVGVTGCGPRPPFGVSGGGATSGAAVTPSVAAPDVTTNARDGLPAGLALTVSVAQGRLDKIAVTGPQGSVEGQLDATGTRWISDAERIPNAGYHVLATATGSAGGTATLDRTFTTGAPARTLTADVTPWGDQQVGVGQPLVVKLSAPVTGAAGRTAVERALVVNADKDLGPASWSWMSTTELHYRPKDFWPAHTKVQVAVNFAGVHAARGLWGTKNRTVSFEIGRAFIMRIDNAAHQMTVTLNGAVVRTVPVSMGRAGYETRSGIKTIMSHEMTVRMTSASYGGKDFYDEIVHYAQRLTWSGEFIHAAPWSVAAQGHSNVSHGCVNVSQGNATWLFGQTLIGDPVITTGTGRQMEPGNGVGGDWNISWARWVAGSALS